MTDEQFKGIRSWFLIISIQLGVILGIMIGTIIARAEEPVDTVLVSQDSTAVLQPYVRFRLIPKGIGGPATITAMLWSDSDSCFVTYSTKYADEPELVDTVSERNHIYYNSDSGTVYRGPYRGVTGVGVRKWIEHQDSTEVK